uniref:Uncharacterized protein n=1 Tax=viral metagenome TaxID=1070528 RepID=A0A6M3LSC4_9ZZZZ
MTIKAQSGDGRIRLFNDFTGVANLVTETTDSIPLGDFYAGGEGIEDNDTGVVPSTTAPLSGSVTVTGGNTDADTTFIGTQIMFDVALMGPLVLETRMQIPDLDTKELFVGFTSILTIDEQLQDIIINGSATAFTCVADLCGFYLSDELTASATAWHAVYKGGTTTASTTPASQTLGVGPTAGEWQILRLEIDPNGDARWFVDGVLLKTVALAASTTSNMAAAVAFAANTTELPIGDVDYILVEANRDWNA